MSKIDLRQGDCLELMKSIPDGSIDMILTDPPYGTTACKWDSVIPFEPMWERINKLIKPNGATYDHDLIFGAMIESMKDLWEQRNNYPSSTINKLFDA